MSEAVLPAIPGPARLCRALGAALFVAVLLLDQGSKYWILHGFDLPDRGSVPLLPGLNFTMVWNRAITFGMLGGMAGIGRVVFSVVSLLIVLLLGVWVTRTTRPWVAGALGAIMGGAVGNVIDRMHYGAVVDFIHAHAYGWSWPVFNLADAAIDCGVAVLLFDSLTDRRSRAPGA
ncbi:lipoprotein signal peptidase [Gluconacetobacter diazotrophicus PA1 5]|uniref:Lipoprotein signal peptidase n=1 Tax=Gluconacetobacter diazotrophicus TaxID=33996 RepID=A0A7W4FCH1_GLUDI|nr:signal peptidase II [Gluconacetobacter diazotrophicus]ACI51190.1 lipoprotein signal peptidase [Gluconacetobacter diazotrophicus PA1 5]MBB2155097.1 signal peptidase II [Gluconacetobacter diazotrophicus]TWB09746.1 signal peptidase II [Gluconacetobacter diazotrophicus]